VSELGEEVMNGKLKISTVISLRSEGRSNNDELRELLVLRCSDGDSDEIDVNKWNRKQHQSSMQCSEG